MPKKFPLLFLFLLALLTLPFAKAHAAGHSMEIFAKVSASKKYLNKDSYIVDVTGSTGFGWMLFSQVRLEGRITIASQNQNKLDVASGSVVAHLENLISENTIYSLGFDIDLLPDKYSVQPFIYIGAGYIVTERSYDVVDQGVRYPITEAKQTGISGNGGIGLRIKLNKSAAFEIEAFGYGQDIDQPSPLVNVFASAGLRLFM